MVELLFFDFTVDGAGNEVLDEEMKRITWKRKILIFMCHSFQML
jgi:hypothetical protein